MCIILRGLADLSIETEGPTLLESGAAPTLHRLAGAGRVGAVATLPSEAEADHAGEVLTLLGMNALQSHPGRAGLDAAAMGHALSPGDAAICVSFLSLGPAGAEDEGLARLAPDLRDAEAVAMATDLVGAWRTANAAFGDVRVLGVRDGRVILAGMSLGVFARVDTTPVNEVVGRDPGRLGPRGQTAIAGELVAFGALSDARLSAHEVNAARAEQGLPPVTLAWPWGAGRALEVPLLRQQAGVRGACITTDPEVRAIAIAAGLTMEGEGGNPIAGAARCIGGYDLVLVHMQAPTHEDDLAKMDQDLGALVDTLSAEEARAPWRLLVVATVAGRPEADRRSPFVLAGSWVRSLVERRFTEEDARESDLQVERGRDLMEYVLHSGVRGRRTTRKGATP